MVRSVVRSVALVVLVGTVSLVGAVPVQATGRAAGARAAAPVPVSINTGGSNGVGRSTQPGLPCSRGGDGASWHYGYESSLPPGTFTSLATDLRMNLDVHGEPAVSPPPAVNGFLQGRESTVSLVNERGTVVLRLFDGGDCDTRTAKLTPTSATTDGDWIVDRGSGAFETISGAGTFATGAGIAPGADNPWTLTLGGNVSVESPEIEVEVVRTYWGNLGLDFLARRPSVQLRITNTGADAFGAQLSGASSPTPGVTLLSGAPAALGDLLPDESVVVTLRYQLGLLEPCDLIITLCEFDISAATSMVDALDRPATEVDSVHAITNIFGPEL